MSVKDIEDYFTHGEESSIDSSIMSNEGFGSLIPLGFHGVTEEDSSSDTEIIIDPSIEEQINEMKNRSPCNAGLCK